MPWGKVDDNFYDHPKLDRLPAKDRLAAIGLHWLAVSWCNRWTTDGHVPMDRVARLGGSIRQADALVGAGLWELDGQGYLIHDFLDFNDSAEDVEARREAEREKKRRQRAAGSAAVGHDSGTGRFRSPVSPDVSRGPSPDVSRGPSPDVSPGDTPGESPATRPGPARPGPAESESLGRTGSTTLGDARPRLVAADAPGGR